MSLGAFDNADLERYTLTNVDSGNLNQSTIVAFDNTTAGGMVALSTGTAGEIAGVIEDMGVDTSNPSYLPVAYIPAGQRSRVRYRGITRVRATNVAISPGTKAYVLTASGKVTNTSNSSANPYIGRFLTGTSGTADEMVVVDLRLG